MANRARVLTSTMSANSAMLSPAPKATPSTAAINGLSSAMKSLRKLAVARHAGTPLLDRPFAGAHAFDVATSAEVATGAG